MPQTPPPPPYNQITGISRADAKYNEQETLADYNGNARPGELVIDLTSNPPALYVGNNIGQLTAVGGGGGSTTWATLGDKDNSAGPVEIALGQDAGTAQGTYAVAIGATAGNVTQGLAATAIGYAAGQGNQGTAATAVGAGAALLNQGANATAVGQSAGASNQGVGAVAVGSGAGADVQGANAIAIGSLAGTQNQTNMPLPLAQTQEQILKVTVQSQLATMLQTHHKVHWLLLLVNKQGRTLKV